MKHQLNRSKSVLSCLTLCLWLLIGCGTSSETSPTCVAASISAFGVASGVGATFVGLLASYFSPYLWIGAGIIVACAVTASFFPAYTIDLAGVLTFFMNLQMAWHVRPLNTTPDEETL